jgi:hypothetical protein
MADHPKIFMQLSATKASKIINKFKDSIQMPDISLQQLSSPPNPSYFQLAQLDDEGQMEEHLSIKATNKY